MVLSVVDDAGKAKDEVRTEEERRRMILVAEMIFISM